MAPQKRVPACGLSPARFCTRLSNASPPFFQDFTCGARAHWGSVYIRCRAGLGVAAFLSTDDTVDYLGDRWSVVATIQPNGEPESTSRGISAWGASRR